ncbi:MAG: hypothetical protein P4L84_38035 [Isosphaeraceae bacterium]|nr:hypothetical protein [Isosphaeraceae bacterium]
MQLTWPGGNSDEPTEALIRELVPKVEHLILSAGELTYIQFAWRTLPPRGLVLEYQDGSMEQHYRGAMGPYDAETCISAMVKYLRGDPSWHTDIRVWEHLDMEKLLRDEARWRREDARAARRARPTTKRPRPSQRRRRPSPLGSDLSPQLSQVPGADPAPQASERSAAEPSWLGVLRMIRQVISALHRFVRSLPSRFGRHFGS